MQFQVIQYSYKETDKVPEIRITFFFFQVLCLSLLGFNSFGFVFFFVCVLLLREHIIWMCTYVRRHWACAPSLKTNVSLILNVNVMQARLLRARPVYIGEVNLAGITSHRSSSFCVGLCILTCIPLEQWNTNSSPKAWERDKNLAMIVIGTVLSDGKEPESLHLPTH